MSRCCEIRTTRRRAAPEKDVTHVSLYRPANRGCSLTPAPPPSWRSLSSFGIAGALRVRVSEAVCVLCVQSAACASSLLLFSLHPTWQYLRRSRVRSVPVPRSNGVVLSAPRLSSADPWMSDFLSGGKIILFPRGHENKSFRQGLGLDGQVG